MTSALQEPEQPSSTLVEAFEVLNRTEPILDEAELGARLCAIQQACSRLVHLVEGSEHLPTDLLENALEAVSTGLGAARQHIEAAQGQLHAVKRAAWSQMLLAAADTCLHSQAWHAAWHADVGAGGKDAYLRTAVLVRDMLKEGLLPLLVGATEQQSVASGFCLATQFKSLLDMGRTAGEVVGMRDPRHHCPGLRNFSVLNVLWNGIQRLWVAVPEEVQADMEQQGLGGGRVLEVLLGFMRKDIRACHQLLDPGMGKLLLYWVQKAGHVLSSFPSAGPACWPALLEVPLCAHQELARLAVAGGGGNVGSAMALAEALRHKVLPNAVRLLVASLNTPAAAAAEDTLRVMLDVLRMRLSAGDQPGLALPALRTALHLLHSAPSLQPLARHHCVALLGCVLDALPGPAFAAALQFGELRRQVEDAVLAFLAACCHTATTTAGSHVLQAWERQLVAQTWERCQQQLFLHALQPHPLTAHVLGCVWSDLAAAASEALLKSHIITLHDLLRMAAAVEAVEGGHVPPSPLYLQLLELLAGLLAAAPPDTLLGYYDNFLKVLPGMSDDSCQLACLSAELRLAALVDTASGAAAAAPQVKGVLQDLFRLLDQAGLVVMKRLSSGGGGGGAEAADGGEEEAAIYLAWLLEALQCAVAYVFSTSLQQDAECRDLLGTLTTRLLYLLPRTVGRGVFTFAAPSLAMLKHLLPTPPGTEQGGLPAEQGGALALVLAACQQCPELAATAATLAPALAKCAVPHAELLHAVLSEQGPVLQHVGLEAYRLYARSSASHAHLVTAAIPPSMRNLGKQRGKAAPVEETGLAAPRFAALLHQYWQRSPDGSMQLGEQEAAAWAAALREEALGAAVALRRAVEAQRVLAAAAKGAGVGHSGPPSQATVMAAQQIHQASNADSSMSVATAVQEVMRSIKALDSLLQGGGSGGGGLDAASTGALHQCSAQLTQLLATGSA